MSGAPAFGRLHPALQHHIVNSLGWTSLRPLQEQAIGPVLDGDHALLMAPTASGKTEAAALPLLSRMLSGGWRGPSVLYVCPLKALLNNIEPRLRSYGALVGRRVDTWHGDVGAARRRQIVREPPDLLLTTPESLEVLLVSSRAEPRALLRRVQAAVVDELHAFAGDDRGWHLLAVLERVRRLAGREFQRLGLSATIGDPEPLLDWLAPAARRPRRIVTAPGAAAPAAVQLDHVANVRNAAKVVAALHQGEKRLVFCDSRARVETLAAELRLAGAETFVSHGSLGLDERRRAEEAFARGRDCVIVATATLELGVDVGDLDRVIQIDAPPTVAAFLQRLGRTGRRPGTSRNCLLLATSDEGLLRAAGLLRLWREGRVEPVVPPPEPFHVFAQQILALALQEGRVGRAVWREWLGAMPAFRAMARRHLDEIVAFMLAQGLLHEEAGMLSIGAQGERAFGRRHFLELMSVFTSAPLFAVRHGRSELGFVHPLSFQVRRAGPVVLLLAGRSWEVSHVDWSRRAAYVKAARGKGRSRWLGSGVPLRFDLCRAVRQVLADGRVDAELSRRARRALDAVRDDFSWVAPDSTAVVDDGAGATRWWTFAGLRANTALGELLGPLRRQTSREGNLSIRLRDRTGVEEVRRRLARVDTAAWEPAVPVADDAVDALKFSACLPRAIAVRTLRARSADGAAARTCAAEPIRGATLA